MIKHFLKTLIIFIALIIIGLIGVFLIGNSDKGGNLTNTSNNQTQVTK